MTAAYVPTDTLFLWYLAQPERPVLIGELNLVLRGRGVSLRYAPAWLAHGFALSEDLALAAQEWLPRAPDLAAGAVDDARPDRWGERVIRQLERSPRFSIIEMLYFAGDARFGALGVSRSATEYLPHPAAPLPQLSDVADLHSLVARVAAGLPVGEAERRLIAPGASLGGSRPKAQVEIEGAPWLLKFAESGFEHEPLVEHASMTLAAQVGITVAQTRVLHFARGVALAVRRFDRVVDESGMPRRLHALSAGVALPAAGAPLSYPALAQLLRRRGAPERYAVQMRELFRRMVFNILIDNTDDHEKNHALLVDDAQYLHLSPVYDVLPTGLGLGVQSLEVGEAGHESSLANALSMAAAFGWSAPQARAEMQAVVAVVDNWRSYFAQQGVAAQTIEQLGQQIDKSALRRV